MKGGGGGGGGGGVNYYENNVTKKKLQFLNAKYNVICFGFLFSFLICSFSFHSFVCLMVVIVLCSQWFASEVEEKSQTVEVLVIEELVIEVLVIEELVIER